MLERYEIRFAGSGGQGIITAGIIMGEAASIYDGKYAVQSQSYGPEARGGASKSEVIIADVPISYPKATNPDLLVALNQESFDKYIKDVKKGGIVIVDSDYVKVPDEKEGEYVIYHVPIVETARNEIGKTFVVNIVFLGVVREITGIVSHDALEKAILNRVPKGTEELNIKAFEAGIRLAKEVKKN